MRNGLSDTIGTGSFWFLVSLLFLIAGQSMARSNQCLEFMPDDIIKPTDVRICTSTYNGEQGQYSCQDFVSTEGRYRILYKGGLVPKAILKFDKANRKQLIWSPLFGDSKLSCPLAPPEGVPYRAVHRGVGVCQDEHDNIVPCSIYEHAAPRNLEAYRYFAFYDPEGQGPATVDSYVAGENTDAMVAELSFQLGMSLLATDCCQQQGFEYLKHAYNLFPRAEAYRRAYHRTKAILTANNDQDQ